MCGSEEFSCGSKDKKCINRKLVCDGSEDCDNGLDEQNCTNSSMYSVKYILS